MEETHDQQPTNNDKENLLNAVERLEKANQEKQRLLEREESLAAKRLLGGQSEQVETEKKKEETDEEYTRRVEKEIREGKYNQ